MSLLNSIKILFNNFGNLYKILFYRFIVFVFCTTLTLIFVLPNVLTVLNSPETVSLIQSFKGIITDFFKNSDLTPYGNILKESIFEFNVMLQASIVNIVMAVAFGVFIFLVSLFLNGLCNYTMGIIINDHLTKLSHMKFMTVFVLNFRKAVKYQLVYMLMTLLYDIFTLTLGVFVLVMLLSSLGFLAITIALLLVCFLFSLKLSLLSGFLPHVIINESTKMFSALKQSIVEIKPRFRKILSDFFMIFILLFVINVMFAIFSFFSSIVITLPLTYLLLTILSFVNYFSATNRKYYINYDEINVPKECRDEEKLLNNMDIE